jgi:3-dehydroquinate dehydratase type I
LTIKVCVSVLPKTVEEALCLIEEAETQNADLIEIRLDLLKKYDRISEIPHCSKTLLIATNKSLKQNGKFSGSEIERQKTLIDAARNDFQYVDVNLSTPNVGEFIVNLKEAGAKLIVSFHDFQRTPELPELNKILNGAITLGADVCKIVTTARNIKDNLTTLNFISEVSQKVKIVCFAMGELGKPSRLLSPIFGAFFTFVSIDEKRKTAKGQLSIHEIRRAYEILGL